MLRRTNSLPSTWTCSVVKLRLVPTDEMEADIFTKPLPDAVFEKHRDKVMSVRRA